MHFQENLESFLNTNMDDVILAGKKIKAVVCHQNSTETEYTIYGDIFVDATGHGTLATMCGATGRMGSEGRDEFKEPDAPEEPNSDTMGNTLLFSAVDRGEPVKFVCPEWANHYTEEDLKYREHANSIASHMEGGKLTKFEEGSGRLPHFSNVDSGYWWIELGGEDEDIIRDGEKIRDELLKCVYGVWDHLKNVGNHGVENLELDWVGFVPGYRESRRIEGDYLLNEKDVLANRIFPDAVAYGGWQMDQHVRRGLLDTDKIPSQILNFNGCYTIPWRCYYAKDLENVMLAGRDISTTKMAFGSTRVMGTCAVGGQAVGTAAAMAVRYGCTPRQIGEHMEELQQELLRDDCYIPGFRNTDPQDLARTAQISATSAREGFAPEKVINGVSRDENGIRNMWSSDGISPEGETLTLKLASVKKVSKVRLTFDSNFNYPIKITLSKKRQLQQRIGVPPELVKDYTVTLWRGEQKMAEQKVTENDQRQNVVTFEPTECDKVTITIHTTNGEKDVHIYEVRVYS